MGHSSVKAPPPPPGFVPIGQAPPPPPGFVPIGQVESDQPSQKQRLTEAWNEASQGPSPFARRNQEFIESGIQFGKDTYEALSSPLQTAAGLAKVAAGAIQKAVPGEHDFGQEEYAEAVWKVVVDRYGSAEAFRKTAKEDPVGLMADLSTAIAAAGGGASLLRMGAQAAGATKTASIAGRLGRGARTAETLTDPLQLGIGATGVGIKAGGQVASKMFESLVGTPESIYRSALKPTNALAKEATRKKGQQAVQTGLEEGIVVGKKGAVKGHELVAELDALVQENIQLLDSVKISPESALGPLKKYRAGVAREATPGKKLKAIDKELSEFRERWGDKTVSPAHAQFMKRKLYKDINNAWGELKSASVEAKKALARGLKLEIERVFPEIKNLNSREGKLLNLDVFLEKAVMRIDNRDIVGFGPMVATLGGGVVAGKPGAALGGLLKAIIDGPGLKSRFAIVLNQYQKRTRKPGRVKRATRAGRGIPTPASRIEAYRRELEELMSQEEIP